MLRALIERLRVPLLLLLLVALALLAIASDRRALARGDRESGWWRGVLLELAAPVQKALTAPVDGTRNAWSHYVALRGVRQENERLRERLAQLEEENLQFREALVEGGRLRTIADMRRDVEVPMRPAQVVGMDVSPWFHSVLVDRGRSDGVHAGMPVVTEDGVVGVITATSPNAARTLLLLDAQSSVDGIVQRSRARGIVRGTGGDGLEFEFFVRGDDVQVGDLVITSGFGGVHPKGSRIGEVVAVHADPTAFAHRAVLRPAVDFGRLEQVFVLLWRGPALDLLYDGEGDQTGPVSETTAGRQTAAPAAAVPAKPTP
ncbi:rod shape-determining protein MreC [Myxococcota bacterium]|nr:rod shape-determining protein MreC [Myxococcota bacterium]MCZ7620109.1 rod shape-determining protein MreC [Myxococcota bacterium]